MSVEVLDTCPTEILTDIVATYNEAAILRSRARDLQNQAEGAEQAALRSAFRKLGLSEKDSIDLKTGKINRHEEG